MDENEALIEYSEMTSFDFNSKEFQEVKNDYIKCRDFVYTWSEIVKNFVSSLKKTSAD